MELFFKKLVVDAKMPSKACEWDAGYDLYACENSSISPMERKIINLGISVDIPRGFYGRIAPRSGLAINKGVDVLGGVIDSGYRGELKVILINLNLPEFLYSQKEDDALHVFNHIFDSGNSVILNQGDRVAQLIIERCHNVDWEEVEELSDTERESGGFGSTGA